MTQSIVPHKDNIKDWQIFLRYLQEIGVNKNQFFNAIVVQAAENVTAHESRCPSVICIELRFREET